MNDRRAKLRGQTGERRGLRAGRGGAINIVEIVGIVGIVEILCPSGIPPGRRYGVLPASIKS